MPGGKFTIFAQTFSENVLLHFEKQCQDTKYKLNFEEVRISDLALLHVRI